VFRVFPALEVDMPCHGILRVCCVEGGNGKVVAQTGYVPSLLCRPGVRPVEPVSRTRNEREIAFG